MVNRLHAQGWPLVLVQTLWPVTKAGLPPLCFRSRGSRDPTQRKGGSEKVNPPTHSPRSLGGGERQRKEPTAFSSL